MTRLCRAACLLALLLAPWQVGTQSQEPLRGCLPCLTRRCLRGQPSRQTEPGGRWFPERVYVPNSGRNTVDVIDPHVQDHRPLRRGKEPQHVTPSYDLKNLWVLSDLGDSVTRIDPATGRKGETLDVKDPYNMYFTPDGQYAIVVAERLHRLDFRDAQTMKLVDSLVVPCRGVDHMDFSANGRYLIASCEFSGEMVKVDVATHKLLGTLKLPGAHPMPQDVRLTPDGSIFYVADMMSHGVHIIDGDSFKLVGFTPTGKGTHGLYFSRDSRWLYVSNRDEGTISLIDVKTRQATGHRLAGRAACPRTAECCGCQDVPRGGLRDTTMATCSHDSDVWQPCTARCLTGSLAATVGSHRNDAVTSPGATLPSHRHDAVNSL